MRPYFNPSTGRYHIYLDEEPGQPDISSTDVQLLERFAESVILEADRIKRSKSEAA